MLVCFDFIQLSDFGLATWASTSSSHITCTDVAGTFGLVLSNPSKTYHPFLSIHATENVFRAILNYVLHPFMQLYGS